jgi:hypothetical protein
VAGRIHLSIHGTKLEGHVDDASQDGHENDHWLAAQSHRCGRWLGQVLVGDEDSGGHHEHSGDDQLQSQGQLDAVLEMTGHTWVATKEENSKHTMIPMAEMDRGKHTAPQPALRRSSVWAATIRAAQGTSQVGTHASHILDVVTDVVSDGGGVVRIVLGMTSVDEVKCRWSEEDWQEHTQSCNSENFNSPTLAVSQITVQIQNSCGFSLSFMHPPQPQQQHHYHHSFQTELLETTLFPSPLNLGSLPLNELVKQTISIKWTHTQQQQQNWNDLKKWLKKINELNCEIYYPNLNFFIYSLLFCFFVNMKHFGELLDLLELNDWNFLATCLSYNLNTNRARRINQLERIVEDDDSPNMKISHSI